MNNWLNEHTVIGLTNRNTVKLPKHIRLKNRIITGQEVSIYYEMGNIFIKEKQGDSLEIKTVISSDGSIYLPVEIRRIYKINKDTKFEVYSNNDMMIKLVKFAV